MNDDDENSEDLVMLLNAISDSNSQKPNDNENNKLSNQIDQNAIENNNKDINLIKKSQQNYLDKDCKYGQGIGTIDNDEGKEIDIDDDLLINPNDIVNAKDTKEKTDEDDQLNIAVDERMIIKEDEYDDDDEDDYNDDKDGVINFKAEIEAKDDINEENDNNGNKKENNGIIINDFDQKDHLLQNPLNSDTHLYNDKNKNQLIEIPLSKLRTKQHYDKSHFEIISLLNKGCHASILKAKYIKNEMKIQIKALKVIVEISMDNQLDMLHKIYVENEILLKLKHPNIIQLEGAFEEKDKIFLVMEYFPKGNFADFLKINYPLHENAVRFYTGEIINALAYLRVKKIVHCNIRPDNIMLDENYHLKLISFSNAKIIGKIFNCTTMRFEGAKGKLINEDDRDLNTNLFFNQNESPEYASPEAINNHPYCGFGTDLWALGCIIYQMYVGSTPFKDKSDHLIVQNIQKNLIEYPPYIPKDAQDLISQLLVYNSSKRLGSGDIGSLNDLNKLKCHDYFNNVDFSELYKDSVPHQSEFRIITTNKPQILANSRTFQPEIKPEPMNGESFMRNHTKTIATIRKSIVDKKSPWLHYNRRIIVLDTTPKLEYIDPKKNIIKGVIFLNKDCQAIHIDAKKFELVTPKRIFRFKVCYNSYSNYHLD